MPQLQALTGLRFLAALEVVLYHFSKSPHHPFPEWMLPLFSAGVPAVTLFFVLSGFILTYSHLGRGETHIPWLPMYASRVARIYPVYAVALVLSAPIFLGVEFKTHPDTLAANLLMKGAAVLMCVQSYVPSWALAWNPPAWSISAEFTFYALFPLLAPRIMKLNVSKALWMGLGTWLAALLPSLLYVLAGVQEDVTVHPWRDVVIYNPLLRLGDFVLGIATARVFLSRLHSQLPPLRWAVPVALLGTLVLFVASWIPDILLHTSLLAPCFALLILGLAQGTGMLAAFLSTPVMKRLGESSYALYILHVPLMFWVAIVGDKVFHQPVLGRGDVVFCSLLGIQAVALLVWKTVEVPARTALRARLTRVV